MERLKLRGRIIEEYGTIGAFVDRYGTTYQTVANVLSGKITPKGLTLIGWLTALKIPIEEAHIFFAEK